MNCSQQTKANIFVSYKVFVNIFVGMSVSLNSCELILMTPAVFFVCLLVCFFSSILFITVFYLVPNHNNNPLKALYISR